MTTSPAPISAADRDADALLRASTNIATLGKRVVELEAALAKYRCPLGMENGSTICSAGSCPECLESRIYAGWHQLNASEARATALLEAAKPFVRHYEPWMEQWADAAQSSTFPRHTFGELRALVAAINAGASNDRK